MFAKDRERTLFGEYGYTGLNRCNSGIDAKKRGDRQNSIKSTLNGVGCRVGEMFLGINQKRH